MREGELEKDQRKQDRETNVAGSSGMKDIKPQGHHPEGHSESPGAPKRAGRLEGGAHRGEFQQFISLGGKLFLTNRDCSSRSSSNSKR